MRKAQSPPFRHGLRRWLLEGQAQKVSGPYEPERHAREHTRPWWQVVCLTGVDYFSSLGYAPGIAFAAAGVVSPIATVVLVLLTLLGALPVYLRVARESPHGSGSIAMLERLLRHWGGKLFVLALLGFAATDFMITITLSAADAAAHFVQNPLVTHWLGGQNVTVTLLLVALLGAVFLRGFREAIGVATVLVALYLGLNAVVVVRGVAELLHHPEAWGNWQSALLQGHGSPLGVALVALLVFPKLALGMSGFETGVAVMPLVEGAPGDDPARPAGRIRNTRKLLISAAVIMSSFLILTSVITTLLIPAPAFLPGGAADGRALAYIAHRYLGNGFGSAYDISTILILWFAGASAMAGLLNLVPRYLPRYGMAPEWARANRPLVLIFTAIGFLITLIFKANVDAQGGAYATGVLVLMTSAAIAVTLSARSKRQRGLTLAFGAITLVLAYTLLTNVIERPDGVKIGALFILAFVVVGLWSRLARATELRADTVEVAPAAARLLDRMAARGELRFIAHHRQAGSEGEYSEKEREVRAETHLPAADAALFLEVQVTDPSEFAGTLTVRAEQVGRFAVLRLESPSVSNAIAAFLLWARDHYGAVPHVYFEWTERGPLAAALDFVLFGSGDVAPLTHEVLREAEPDLLRRPVVHVGG